MSRVFEIEGKIVKVSVFCNYSGFKKSSSKFQLFQRHKLKARCSTPSKISPSCRESCNWSCKSETNKGLPAGVRLSWHCRFSSPRTFSLCACVWVLHYQLLLSDRTINVGTPENIICLLSFSGCFIFAGVRDLQLFLNISVMYDYWLPWSFLPYQSFKVTKWYVKNCTLHI